MFKKYINLLEGPPVEKHTNLSPFLELIEPVVQEGPGLRSIIKINNPNKIGPNARRKVFELAYQFSKRTIGGGCSWTTEPFVDELDRDSMFVHAAEHLTIGILHMNNYHDVGGYTFDTDIAKQHYHLGHNECALRIVWGPENHEVASIDDAKSALQRALGVVNKHLNDTSQKHNTE